MALTDNLTAYYKLDESSGNAADSAGSNTGTNTDVTYTAAKINNGGSFNGTSSLFACGDDASIQFSSAFTIATWVNFDALPGTNTDSQFVAKWNASTNQRSYRWGLQDTAGTKSLRIGVSSAGSATVEASTNYTPSTATWYHFVCTWNAGAWVMYVNGASIGSGTTSVTALFDNTETLKLGKRGDGGLLNGLQDEIGLWSRAITSDEVTTLYNGGAGLQYPFTPTPFLPIRRFNQAINRASTY